MHYTRRLLSSVVTEVCPCFHAENPFHLRNKDKDSTYRLNLWRERFAEIQERVSIDSGPLYSRGLGPMTAERIAQILSRSLTAEEIARTQ